MYNYIDTPICYVGAFDEWTAHYDALLKIKIRLISYKIIIRALKHLKLVELTQ